MKPAICNSIVYTARNLIVIDVTSVKKCRPWPDAASETRRLVWVYTFCICPKVPFCMTLVIYGKVTLAPWWSIFFKKSSALKEFEKQLNEKYFCKKTNHEIRQPVSNMESDNQSQRRRKNIWYLAAIATRGITRAGNFYNFFVLPVHWYFWQCSDGNKQKVSEEMSFENVMDAGHTLDNGWWAITKAHHEHKLK